MENGMTGGRTTEPFRLQSSRVAGKMRLCFLIKIYIPSLKMNHKEIYRKDEKLLPPGIYRCFKY